MVLWNHPILVHLQCELEVLVGPNCWFLRAKIQGVNGMKCMTMLGRGMETMN
jgi:hypothetical protein